MQLEPNLIMQQTLQKMLRLPSNLRWFGDPVLRQYATLFEEDEITSQEAADLAEQLKITLKHIRDATGLGRAIAAPQIGILRRMFVAYNAEEGEYDVFINPIILNRSDELGSYVEMCLSGIPIAGKVIRPWQIEIGFYDREGIYHQIQPDPLFSRVAQHEIDHLDGILFVDHTDPKDISLEFDWDVLKARNGLVKL